MRMAIWPQDCEYQKEIVIWHEDEDEDFKMTELAYLYYSKKTKRWLAIGRGSDERFVLSPTKGKWVKWDWIEYGAENALMEWNIRNKKEHVGIPEDAVTAAKVEIVTYYDTMSGGRQVAATTYSNADGLFAKTVGGTELAYNHGSAEWFCLIRGSDIDRIEKGESIMENRTITPDELRGVLRVAINERFPLMVWGPPGVGKSQVTAEVAEELGYEFHDIRASLIDPVDLRGLPHLDKDAGVTRWAAPSFLPPTNGKGKYMVMLDEITVASPSIQASLYQLVQDRGIGEYRLPDGAVVIAAGNRAEDLGVSNRMPAPLANRMIHVTVEVSPPQFVNYILKRDLNYIVAMYIKFRPETLHGFDAQTFRNRTVAFASPRMWERVARLMDAEVDGVKVRDDKELLATLVFGAVGEGAGSEFIAFLNIFRELPPIPNVIASPNSVFVPEDPSAQIALCGALIKEANEDNLDNILKFAKRLPVEMHQFVLTLIGSMKPKLQQTGIYVSWAAELDD